MVVRFATWQEGFLLKGGQPQRHVRGVEDLARPDVRIVNREKGAGALDCFLDQLLSRHRLSEPNREGLWNDGVFSDRHLDDGLRKGRADVGIGAQAVAQLYGFDFIPLQEERYDLVIPDGVSCIHIPA